MTYQRNSVVRAENEALRAELARVYRALADANSRLRSGSSAPAHPFGQYLLGQVA